MKPQYFLLFYFFLTFSTSLANASNNESSDTQDLLTLPLNFVKIEEFIETYPKADIDFFIENLPPVYQSIQHVSYVHSPEPHGKQEAHLDGWRAILHGPDGEFIITISAAEDKGNPSTAEMWEFKNSKGRKYLEFRRHKFSPSSNVKPEGNNKAHENSIWHGEQTKCTTCHDRPIWENYPNWTNAIGVQSSSYSPNALIDAYERFAPKMKNIPGFRKLDSIDIYTQYFHWGEVAKKEKRPTHQALKILREANVHLNSKLSDINAQLIANELVRDPKARLYLYAVLGALAQCSDIESFVPRDIRDQFKVSIAGLQKELKIKHREMMLSTVNRMANLDGHHFSSFQKFREALGTRRYPLNRIEDQNRFNANTQPKAIDITAMLMYILQNTDVDVYSWEMQVKSKKQFPALGRPDGEGYFPHYSPIHVDGTLAMYRTKHYLSIFEAVISEMGLDPSVFILKNPQYYNFDIPEKQRGPHWRNKFVANCQKLKDKSLNKLSSQKLVAHHLSPLINHKGKDLLHLRCAGCHKDFGHFQKDVLQYFMTHGEGQEPHWLSDLENRLLHLSPESSDWMPRNSRDYTPEELDKDEVNQIIDYLRSLGRPTGYSPSSK